MRRNSNIIHTLKKYFFIALLLLGGVPGNGFAQDPHFSQFFDAPLLRNPALAGIFNGDIRVQSVYRNQWSAVTTPYVTGSLNAEYKQPFGKGNDFITLGMEILYDKAGATNFSTTSLLPAFNFHKSLSDVKSEYLSVGFMAGWVNKYIDRSKITTNNQFDGYGYNPSLPDGEILPVSSYNYWDGSVGVSFSSSISGRKDDNYFIGLAYHHLNRPENSFYRDPSVELDPKWVISGGLRYSVNEVSFVTLQGDFSKEGAFTETVAGVMFSRKIGSDYETPDYILHFGGFLRWKDAFIPVFKIEYHPFLLGISYDVNVSDLKTASQSVGAFELSITYTGFLDRDNSTKNAVLCPRF
jgi:type IX secretion system PorP/SprF family membrane protein